jgi:DNA mismatch endonuclease Vsr
MAAVRSTDTKPEMQVRRMLHRLGYRYRLHVKAMPGKPDLVFPVRRAVLEIRGCWFHGHLCPRGARVPATRRDYWTAKIAGNMARDARNLEALAALGWRVMEIWECELRNPALPERILSFLGPPGHR